MAVINAKPRLRRLFRLRTILLVVMLSILFLPLSSLFFFRFYENELVRKTENELIMQSAVFASVYRALIGQDEVNNRSGYTPITPQLDLSKHKILARRPEAVLSKSYNQTDGYPLAQSSGKTMQKILQNAQKFTLAGMRILDKNGVVIAGRAELNMSLAHVKEVQGALKGRYTSVLRERISDEPPPSIASISRGTGVRVFTAFPIMNKGKVYGVVYLSRTPQNILKHLYSIKEKVFLLLLLLLALTGLIVLFISSRLSRPIRELINQTKKVISGEIETVKVLHQPGTYELSELSHSFAEMSQALQERSHYIQEFASHVSHEFKTPLTSMQGSLELLQEHDMSDEQRNRFISNLQDDTERLKQLVNRLLEQARADVLQTSQQTCNLKAVLAELVSRYSDDSLRLIVDADVDYNLNISASLLQSVFSNLFDNSLQHNATSIKIATQLKDQRLKISLHDNGSGVSESNQQRIFTPFFTTRREKGGTGLGLGIIQSILKASKGEVFYKPSEQGALFIISLNLSKE